MLCKELEDNCAKLQAFNAPAGEGSAWPRKFYVRGLLRYFQVHMPIGEAGQSTKDRVAKLRIQMSEEDVAYFQCKPGRVNMPELSAESTYAQFLLNLLSATVLACQWVSQSGHPLTLGVTSAHVILS